MTKKELLNALKFIAIAQQAYYARGPQWTLDEVTRYAQTAVRLAEAGKSWPKEMR